MSHKEMLKSGDLYVEKRNFLTSKNKNKLI